MIDNDLQESTLHEETLEGWKIQKRFENTSQEYNSGRMVDTPELTDDQITVQKRNSHMIGDGPIFIKKSTDFTSAGRATVK